MKLKTTFFSRLMRPFLTTAAMASLALSANAAGYIKLGDIKGNATDEGHNEWINLISVSQGMGRPVIDEGATGATRRRGDVVLGDIVCVKELDKSSPKLMEAVCTGTVIPEVEIVLTRDVNGRQAPYLIYKLKDVMVTSYNLGASPNGHLVVSNIGSSGEDGIDPTAPAPESAPPPVSNLSLSFEEIQVIYIEFDEQGGEKGNVEYSWKVEEGTK